INIILDVIILVLSLPGLIKLSMSKERKIYIILIFSLGITIVSILRLTSLIKFTNTLNIIWDYVPIG
ncbi:hypothetical protein BJ875DRAFT_336499, partial [Amylocarpus encephaloides]